MQLPTTLLHVDISGNALTRLDALETLPSLRWLDASHNAVKATPSYDSTLPDLVEGWYKKCSAHLALHAIL